MNFDFFNKLKYYIPEAKLVSDNKEILIRCRFCPDSKNMYHAHMYIANDGTYRYHCKKCSSQGVITKSKLIEWGITDFEMLKLIKSGDGARYHDKNSKDIYIKPTRTFDSFNNIKLSEEKLNYINNRLGLSLTYEEASKNKIIINLNDFCINNEFYFNNNFSKPLNENYMGFLSYDNTSINMRCINNFSEKRYYNYTINKNVESTARFYLIPTYIDIYRATTIHISEGPFDILSIKYNLDHDMNQNNIFISVGGISYMTIIKFIFIKLGIINPTINLYLDNDMDEKIKNNLFYKLRNLVNCNIYTINNIFENQKDFGVSKDKIKILKNRIK